jgi:hypothetical protein
MGRQRGSVPTSKAVPPPDFTARLSDSNVFDVLSTFMTYIEEDSTELASEVRALIEHHRLGRATHEHSERARDILWKLGGGGGQQVFSGSQSRKEGSHMHFPAKG